jgi:hypothetical protein
MKRVSSFGGSDLLAHQEFADTTSVQMLHSTENPAATIGVLLLGGHFAKWR